MTRKNKKQAGAPKLAVTKENLSDASQRSLYIPSHYEKRTLYCTSCRDEFVLTAVQQKDIYERQKVYIWNKDCSEDWMRKHHCPSYKK